MLHLIDNKIETYSVFHSTRPSKYCQAIFDYTLKHVPYSQMLIGELEASFLGFLIGLIKAKRVLEIGCYTGYSALAMAERLAGNGEVITLDLDPENTKIAQEFWKKSPDGSKVKLILGNALESLQKLTGSFDFVFIDADKTNYKNYLLKVLPMLSQKGMIAADNCLWGGEVLKTHSQEKDTKAIIEFNDYVKNRKDLHSVLLPIRDGIFLIQPGVSF